MPTFYAFMTCLLTFTYITADWADIDHINNNKSGSKIATLHVDDEDANGEVPTETSALLHA